jgi:hypothetical protein
VADTEKPVENTPDADTSTADTSTKAEAPVAEKPRKTRKDRQTGKKVVAGANAVRSRIASIVWLVAVVCALFLAVGALLIALKANQDNAIVQFVLDGADKLDLKVFSPDEGIFAPAKASQVETKDYLVNWGIGAIAYLVVGKVLDRIIRP